jgi:hypothetical protein
MSAFYTHFDIPSASKPKKQTYKTVLKGVLYHGVFFAFNHLAAAPNRLWLGANIGQPI